MIYNMKKINEMKNKLSEWYKDFKLAFYKSNQLTNIFLWRKKIISVFSESLRLRLFLQYSSNINKIAKRDILVSLKGFSMLVFGI